MVFDLLSKSLGKGFGLLMDALPVRGLSLYELDPQSLVVLERCHFDSVVSLRDFLPHMVLRNAKSSGKGF